MQKVLSTQAAPCTWVVGGRVGGRVVGGGGRSGLTEQDRRGTDRQRTVAIGVRRHSESLRFGPDRIGGNGKRMHRQAQSRPLQRTEVGGDSHAVVAATAVPAISYADAATPVRLPAGAMGPLPNIQPIACNIQPVACTGFVAALRGVSCASAAVIRRQPQCIVKDSVDCAQCASNCLDAGRGGGGCHGHGEPEHTPNGSGFPLPFHRACADREVFRGGFGPRALLWSTRRSARRSTRLWARRWEGGRLQQLTGVTNSNFQIAIQAWCREQVFSAAPQAPRRGRGRNTGYPS